ncbi:MAG: methyltransferase domain-containing protein [Acidimicrobiia bacterium]|nr:methyltransferase domain-containing protein [Acidimicrobiia bacterium]
MDGSIPFDRVAHCYDASRGGEQRARLMAELLAEVLPSDGMVLEVGVGTGIVAAAVADRAIEVLGVDLSPAMAAQARQRLGPKVLVGDALVLPLVDGAVDAAYLVWVLHLVADPVAALAEVLRVVRPGGVVAAIPTSWVGFGAAGTSDGDLERIQARLGVLRAEIAAPDTVAEWLRDVGLEDLTETERVEQREQSPAATATLIEERAWSMLWDVDDATWAELVVPVIEDLRALPEPERPRQLSQRVTLLTGRRP